MQLHNLKPKTKFRKSRRVGRGGKRGTTSGRGTKGQSARAGHKIMPALRDIMKKIPKSRGYKFRPFKSKPADLNLDTLDKNFKEGDTVTPEILVKKGLICRVKGKVPAVKILGRGELKKRLILKDVLLSLSVKTKLKS